MTTKASRKKLLRKPPLVIDGSRVLYYSLMEPSVAYSGHSLIFIGGREIGPVPRLIIAEPLRQKGFQVLHCDKHWNALVHAGGHNSVEGAKRRAGRTYPGITPTWVKYSVSKRKALAIEREMWRGQECSFCNRIPPDFKQSLHSKKARICNICADKIYWDFAESEQVSNKPPRGDYYPENGFDHIASYISRLLVPTKKYRFLLLFALDQMRGCCVIGRGTIVQVGFVLKGQPESSREANIRSFFASRGKRPSSDYLANNGGTRILDYPVNGTVEELTALIKTILRELCDVSPEEALSIKYGQK